MNTPDNHTGGLGVESSNLSAPTTKSLKKNKDFADAEMWPLGENSPKQVQKSRSDAQSPEIIPKSVREAFMAGELPGTADWRDNARNLQNFYGADSPLPTRQLVRATTRAMGREMAKAITRQERGDRITAARQKHRAKTAGQPWEVR